MGEQRIGLIMNGVTGRMGTNQHLIRSIVAIRQQGGVLLPNGDRLMPDPVLVGRSEHKLAALARANGIERWSTDLDGCFANPDDVIYFDAQTTPRRADAVRAAIDAGKHIYCEKPIATNLETSLDLARHARKAGVKNGVVQDKLWLPGLLKLKRLVDSGFFGRILSVRGEFGYWVFEGDWQRGQRPSWNYRQEEGGGIIIDMFCHWQYVLDHIFGRVRSVSCLGATHIPERFDEQGKPYMATADDAAYGTFELEGGIIAQINSSWTVRKAVQLRACASAVFSTARIHRGRSGILIFQIHSISGMTGRRFPTIRCLITPSRCNGKCSYVMSPVTSRSITICWKAPKAYSLPS
jgi:predicted dehydrogenase